MQIHEGVVNSLNWNYTSKKGNVMVFMQVDGQKYYPQPDVVDKTIQIGDKVRIEYEKEEGSPFRSVSKAVVIEPAPPGQGRPGETGKIAKDSTIGDHVDQGRYNQDVSIRQTALKCASELMANKIMTTATGSEGVCALANDFVAYLKEGKMPEAVKTPSK